MTMGSAGRNTVVAFFMIAALLQSANAATKTVGGSTGWTLGISSTFYDDWANGQTFAVGDTLDFAYSGTSHNVFEVTQAELTSCSVTSPLKTYDTSGGASVAITTAGAHYYICGVPGHCQANMQMTISVPAAAPTSPPTVTPAPSKAAPAPAKSAPAPAPAKSAPAPAPAKAAPAPSIVAPAPAPARKSPAPAPSKKSPASAPASSSTPVVPVTSSPVAAAPGPAPGTSKGHQSAAPAMIIGVFLCIVTSLLFQWIL